MSQVQNPTDTIGTSPAVPAFAPCPADHVGRPVSSTQLAAIHAVMQLFVEDDIAAGVDPAFRVYCDGCAAPRPQQGAIRYDQVLLCNRCAIAYEVARSSWRVRSVGEYLQHTRDRTVARDVPQRS